VAFCRPSSGKVDISYPSFAKTTAKRKEEAPLTPLILWYFLPIVDFVVLAAYVFCNYFE
jgi:hypothetical protein